MTLCFLLVFVVLFVLLLSAPSCSANKAVQAGLKAAAGSQSVTLQPWLVGLTAVVVFLFIVFITLIIRRLVKKKREDERGWSYNKAVELEGGDSKQTSL